VVNNAGWRRTVAVNRIAALGLAVAAALAAGYLLVRPDPRREHFSDPRGIGEPAEPEEEPAGAREAPGERPLPHGSLRTIEGVVLSGSDRTAVAGASLEISPANGELAVAPVAARTGTDGRFREEIHAAGSAVDIAVTAPGFVADSFPFEETPVEILLDRGYLLRGLALDESGRSVPGAEVMLVEADAPALLDLPRESLRERAFFVTSDAQGRYRIPTLRPNSFFWILAFADGFSRFPLPQRVRLNEPETRKDVVLSPEQGVLLRLLLPEGIGASRARWSIRPAGHRNRPEPAPDGRWFWPTGTGEFTVRVRMPSWPSSSATFAVEAGKVREGEILVDAGVEIEGVVVDDEHRPIPAAFVEGNPRDGESSDSRSAVCDGWGRFRLRGAARGPWLLRASAKSGERSSARGSGECVAPESGVRLRIPRPCLLRFAVEADQVQVVLLSGQRKPEWTARLRTDAGAVECAPQLAGRYSLLVDAMTGFAGPIDVELTAGKTLDLGRLPLTEGSAATVLVSDAEGKPVRRAQLVADGLGDRPGAPVGGRPGLYGFARLPAGPVGIRISAAGFVPLEARFPEDSRGLAVTLARTARLTVRVADARGRPVPDVEVAVLSTSPEPLRLSRRTGADGVADFELLPGQYSVEAGSTTAESWVDLAPGETRALERTVDPR
jgi:protocatechuate 3,4-dioxygenase beta subunit